MIGPSLFGARTEHVYFFSTVKYCGEAYQLRGKGTSLTVCLVVLMARRVSQFMCNIITGEVHEPLARFRRANSSSSRLKHK